MAATSTPSHSTVRPLAFNLPARLAAIDQRALRRYRLGRVREQLQRFDYAGALLCDPMNIRYATGTRNMQIWTMHAPGRYAFVAADGPVVMFEFSASRHVSSGFETIDEMRTGISAFYFLAGPRTRERAALWATQVAGLVNEHGRCNRRLAVDRCDPWAAQHLTARGIELFDAQEPLEQARKIKSPEEIASLQLAMDVCDVAIRRMREAMQPGITENQLWSVLHEANIAHDGEFIDCRLLASGPRTNPWFQECGNRIIQAGEIVSFDTDMISTTGYMADISRAYVCPGLKPTRRQRNLYALAQEQILFNMALLKPGLAFREFSERSWQVPPEYYANRYIVLAHGVGLCDEFPAVLYSGDQQQAGYDGIFEENMTVSVESYLGSAGGSEGIKLEQEVLITPEGPRPLSSTPLENSLEI